MPDERERSRVYVLGAGLTGLSAAHHLVGHGCTLAEARPEVGGHARSHRREGWTFDLTGHWLHLRDPSLHAWLSALLGEHALARVARKTKIHLDGRLVDYPLQAHIGQLGPARAGPLLTDLVQAAVDRAAGAPRPAHLLEAQRWLFGEGLVEAFFRPYQRKQWGAWLDRLDARAAGRFLPEPTLAQAIGGALGLAQPGLGYNPEFWVCTAGGIDHLARGLAASLQPEAATGVALALSTPLVGLELGARRIELADGRGPRPYDAVISTIPLPELCARTSDLGPEGEAAAANLRAIDWRWIDVAARAPSPAAWHWLYVPDPALPVFRAGIYSNANPAMAPPGCASLYAELAREGPVPTDAELCQILVQLGALGSAEDVAFVERRRIDYAYVVIDEAWAEATATLTARYRAGGVELAGRYGRWDYASMEDALIDGRAAALALRAGRAPLRRGVS